MPSCRPGYPSYDALEASWDTLGARTSVVGHSVRGRPLRVHELGDPGGPTILLSGQLHGMEAIGGLGLRAAVEALLGSAVARRARLVVMPVVNPDAAAVSLDTGRARRSNARGVDLNRNFPTPATRRSWHPFAGSASRWSPYYRGPAALSEPESLALAELARAVRPRLSLGFHSQGGLLLHPWGYSTAPHPRAAEYRALGAAFVGAQARRYRVSPGSDWYPTHGDLDDWLDHTLGTLSFTLEVGRWTRAQANPRRVWDPFWWLNPPEEHIAETVADVARGTTALVEHLLAAESAPAARARELERPWLRHAAR
jgi:carboxypeptidase T